MNGFIGFYDNKRVEVYADTLYAAKLKVAEKLKVPKKKEHMVSVLLAEKAGEVVMHNGSELP